MDKQFFTFKEIEEMGLFGKMEGYKLRKLGLIHTIQIGAAVRVPKAELERIMRDGVKIPKADASHV